MTYPKESMKESTSLEDRLARKFDELQLARETRNHIAFDEIAKSIEVLLKSIPTAHKDLTKQKDELEEDLDSIIQEIENKANNALDQISQEAILNNEGFSAEWDYRETYEEVIMEVLQKYDLIPIRNPAYASIESQPSTAIQEPASKREIMHQPQEEPKREKPHLSIKRKQQTEESNFKV